jgi:DNA invertase Pin-like site-specific DNA recombinase
MSTRSAYVRVSTDDQAAHGASIPSQIKKIEEFCRANGYELVIVFEEPGMSGKDEGRPKFRSMLEQATSPKRPYDIIVVYNLARFARNLAIQTVAYNQLETAGVQLLSVTESFAKGPDGNLMRSILGAFNQNVSDQSSRNTIRTMNLNAAEGFWNGGPVPFGYESYVVEQRKDKAKKKLRINEAEAELVRCIFRLARFGEGAGPMGARAIAQWLNARGFRLRGGKFNNSNVAGILGRTHYVGYYEDGKKTEFKEPIPEEDWIRVPCPAIISDEEFLEVAALRAKRSPKVTPPRVVNGVTMLPASIARCGQPGCDGGLTPRSGKGGQYYYYTCSVRANQGASACDLQAMRRDELDDIVLGVLGHRIFDPERLREILRHLLDRSDEREKRRRKALALARSELTNVNKAITNLVLMIDERGYGAKRSALRRTHGAQPGQEAHARDRRPGIGAPALGVEEADHRRDDRCVRSEDGRGTSVRRPSLPRGICQAVRPAGRGFSRRNPYRRDQDGARKSSRRGRSPTHWVGSVL